MESNLSGVPDVEVIKLYRATHNSACISEILTRYKNFILKTVSRWNSSNKFRVKLTQSDFQDVIQSSNLAIIYMMNNVNLDKIKVLAVTIKSYIYNMLNKCYRYYKYEDIIDVVPIVSREKSASEMFQEKEKIEKVKQFYIQDIRVYLKYYHKYNYYKLGLMTTKSKKKKSMFRTVHRGEIKGKDNLHNNPT